MPHSIAFQSALTLGRNRGVSLNAPTPIAEHSETHSNLQGRKSTPNTAHTFFLVIQLPLGTWPIMDADCPNNASN